jgi:hypothetical protein
MPIATAASAKIKASIMIFSVIAGGRIRNLLADQHLARADFRRIAPRKFLVSRVVAKTGRAFRSLWQEFDTSTSSRALVGYSSGEGRLDGLNTIRRS